MDLLVVFGAFGFLICITFGFLKVLSRSNGNPGPPLIELCYRFLTSQFTTNMYPTLSNWSEKYGKLYTIDLIVSRMHVIGELELMKRVAAHEDLVGKPDALTYLDLFEDGNKHGMSIADGQHWKELRSFVHSQLKSIGYNPASWEPAMLHEFKLLETTLAEEGKLGSGVGGWSSRFIIPTINPVWRLTTGSCISHEDATFKKLILDTRLSFNSVSGGAIFLNSWIQWVAPEISGYNRFRSPLRSLLSYVEGIVGQRKLALDYSSNNGTETLVDAFLKKSMELKISANPLSPFHPKLAEQHLAGVLGTDLLLAGTETPSGALAWSILYLSMFPEIYQIKILHELQNTARVERGETCKLFHRTMMPYTEAFLTEILRLKVLSPVAIASVLKDTELEGYKFKKGELIHHNLHHILQNKGYWGEDYLEFKPERHLTDCGSQLKRTPAFIPFFSGKRRCIGEQYTKDLLFLFISNMVQSFNLELDEGSRGVGLEPIPGSFCIPKDFKVKLTPRT